MAGIMHVEGQTYTTDPDWYTEPKLISVAPTEVLEAVRGNAQTTYTSCGGHKMADRMRRVMRLIDEELAAR